MLRARSRRAYRGSPIRGAASPDTLAAGLVMVALLSTSSYSSAASRLEVTGLPVAAEFGACVDIDSGRALVATNEGKSVYVFARTAQRWQEEAQLNLPANARVGNVVALSGSTALVGNAETDSAYVFQRSGTQWALQASLSADDGASGDHFGHSVALDGERALIGAREQAGTGAAYSFVRNGNGWQQEAKLTSTPPVPDGWFGHAVALDGNRIAVSDYPGPTIGVGNLLFREGRSAVYGFERSAMNWEHKAALTVSSARNGDAFGASLALSGDRLMVGRPDHPATNTLTGAAFVFAIGMDEWQQEAMIDGHFFGSHFGRWVAMVGDRAAIGAAGPINASSYLYVRGAIGWQLDSEVRVDSSDTRQGPIAIDDTEGVIGAPLHGQAFVFGARARGGSCTLADDCAANACADGICCDTSCDSRCSHCNLAGSEGTCSLAPQGSAVPGSCAGHLCDGLQPDCPASCSSDAGCSSSHRCNSSRCVPKDPLGAGCSGPEQCLSGHCIDGRCCDTACDEACASCNVSGLEGTCSIASAGTPGVPSCAPSLCDGQQRRCPQSCLDESDCATGNHCEGGRCAPDQALGSPCDNGLSCGSGLCTHGICCNAAECAPYRCSDAGICASSCRSSAACAPGYQCSSGGQCVEVEKANEESSSSCSLVRPGERPSNRSIPWSRAALMALGVRWLRRRRLRRRRP